MKNIVFISLALLAAGIQPILPEQSKQPLPNTKMTTGATGIQRVPVVVELFTSEGCSSCPPADALLAKLEEEQPIAPAEIIALEEHVDYWNHDGWVDPFSSTQWTARQEDYAFIRHDHGVYTPQMVINGAAEFVGSRERVARESIAKAASQAHTPVTIAAEASSKTNEVQFHVTAGALAPAVNSEHGEVWLAITETGLHSAVAAGENSGVDVHHGAVVRSLRKIGNTESGSERAFSGDAAIKLDKAWKRTNLRAVAFVQEKHSRQIVGAAQIQLDTSTK